MEIKTCEEYVLKELQDVQNENLLLKKELKELKEPKEKEEINVDKGEVFYCNDTWGYYYVVEYENYYNYNEVLKANNKTPDFLREAISSEVDLFRWMDMTSKESYFTRRIGRVCDCTYHYLFTWQDNVAVLCLNDSYMNSKFSFCEIDNNRNFLDKGVAKDTLKQKVLDEIEKYFTYEHDKKFN